MSITKSLVATASLTAAILVVAAIHGPAQARGACRLGAHGLSGECVDPNVVHKSDALGSENKVSPLVSCRAGFTREGSFLCITGVRGPNSYANAQLDCRDISSHVADYIDWRYRIFRGDRVSAPVGFWLGPITADDTALYVNSTDTGNYDGETSRFDSRSYACAYTTN